MILAYVSCTLFVILIAVGISVITREDAKAFAFMLGFALSSPVVMLIASWRGP